MADFKDVIAPISQAVAVAAAAAALATWGYRLQERVETLEARVQVVAIAPGYTYPDGTYGSGSADGTYGSGTLDPQPNTPPIQQACVNLTNKVADAIIQQDKYTAAKVNTLKDMMKELGCLTRR